MQYEILKWDSDFFGIKVAKVTISGESKDEFQRIMDELKQINCKLIYCFINPVNHFNNQLVARYSGLLVDEKVTYLRNIKNYSTINETCIHEYDYGIFRKELISLAIQSSEYSRFRVDKNFKEDMCINLYTQWISNSVKRTFDDAIYVYEENDVIKGIVTLKDRKNIGAISILSVDREVRGKKIGTKLVEKVFEHYKNKEIFNIEVVTQKANHRACNFYEKLGFNVKLIENIYHIWL